MPSPHEQNRDSAPLNRAARRAKRKGKNPAAQDQSPQGPRDAGVRGSQVPAQPRHKGRRGNR